MYPSVVEWSEEILRLMERDHDVDVLVLLLLRVLCVLQVISRNSNPVALRMARFVSYISYINAGPLLRYAGLF